MKTTKNKLIKGMTNLAAISVLTFNFVSCDGGGDVGGENPLGAEENGIDDPFSVDPDALIPEQLKLNLANQKFEMIKAEFAQDGERALRQELLFEYRRRLSLTKEVGSPTAEDSINELLTFGVEMQTLEKFLTLGDETAALPEFISDIGSSGFEWRNNEGTRSRILITSDSGDGEGEVVYQKHTSVYRGTYVANETSSERRNQIVESVIANFSFSAMHSPKIQQLDGTRFNISTKYVYAAPIGLNSSRTITYFYDKNQNPPKQSIEWVGSRFSVDHFGYLNGNSGTLKMVVDEGGEEQHVYYWAFTDANSGRVAIVTGNTIQVGTFEAAGAILR